MTKMEIEKRKSKMDLNSGVKTEGSVSQSNYMTERKDPSLTESSMRAKVTRSTVRKNVEEMPPVRRDTEDDESEDFDGSSPLGSKQRSLIRVSKSGFVQL